MRKNNSGLIINITSIAGYIGLPYRGIFCASKSALEILTESLRSEIKDFGIKGLNENKSFQLLPYPCNNRINLLIASTEDEKSIEKDAKTNFKIAQKICKNAGY